MERWTGLYRSIVIENDETKDPEYTGKLTGKIKVVVPEIHRLPFETATNEAGDNPARVLQKVIASGQGFWARPCFPWGGKDIGEWYIPPIDAGVWIMFEAGVVSYPVWLGVWNTPKGRMTLPTGLDKDYKVYNSGVHLIEIKNKAGEEEFHYKHLLNNFELTIDKDGKVTLSVPDTVTETFAKAVGLTFQDTFTVNIAKAADFTFQDTLTAAVTKATTLNLSENITFNLGSKKMVVNAAAAEMCGTLALALFSEIQTLATEMNTFITTVYNLHMHPTAGTGPPSAPTLPGTAPTTPVGTTKLKGA
jgi:hypothetical protein